MQEGMRRKSKDIHYFISIFYLAKNLLIYIYRYLKVKLIKKKLFTSRLVYCPAFKIERACSIPPTSS